MQATTTSFNASLVAVALWLTPAAATGAATPQPVDCTASNEARANAAEDKIEGSKDMANEWFSEVDSEQMENCISGLAKPTFGGSSGLPSNIFAKLLDQACNTAVSEVNSTIDSAMGSLDSSVDRAPGAPLDDYFDLDAGTTTASVSGGEDLVDHDVEDTQKTIESLDMEFGSGSQE